MNPDFTLKKRTKALIYEGGAYPSKGLGQNFLIDRQVLGKIAKAANLAPNDVVLEIGPGSGNLTREIGQRVKKAIVVEKDRKLCEILKETLKDFNNVRIIQGDILKIPHSTFNILHSYKVVANSPFYLVAPVIIKFLESENPPEVMVLVTQKEVAQRICARPPEMNLLAVSVQFYAKAGIVSYVSKKSFWPQPKVDSAILRITQIHADKKTDKHRFFEIVRAGFSQPRKQLANNLAEKLELSTRATAKGEEEDLSSSTREKAISWLEKNKIQPSQRAETLKIEDWLNLARSYPF